VLRFGRTEQSDRAQERSSRKALTVQVVVSALSIPIRNDTLLASEPSSPEAFARRQPIDRTLRRCRRPPQHCG